MENEMTKQVRVIRAPLVERLTRELDRVKQVLRKQRAIMREFVVDRENSLAARNFDNETEHLIEGDSRWR